MTDEYRQLPGGNPGDLFRQFKFTGTDPTTGKPVYAEVLALEAGSIGGGGGGAVTIADGADVAQGTTTDLSTANTVVGLLKAIKAVGPLTDTQLRATAVPVSGTFWQATQPVSGTFWQATQPVSGTVTANAGTNLNTSALALESGGNLATVAGAIKAEDAASAGGENLMLAGTIRQDTPASTTSTDGDYQNLKTDSIGKLWVNAGGVALDCRSATAANFNALVGGDVASGGAQAGNPLNMGGRSATSPPTAVANAQRVAAMFDIYGKQVVRESLREDLGNQQTTITSSTTETTVVTADATYKLDLYCLIITNTSATGTKVTIKDSTAGTTRMVVYVPPTETRGFVVSPSGAHKQNAANNNWTATCGTSVASIELTAMWTRSL